MKLEDQVISLELAVELKRLGFKQDSLHYWYRGIMVAAGVKRPEIVSREFYEDHNVEKATYSAYTVAELGEMLPDYCFTHKQEKDNDKWFCSADGKNYWGEGDTEANTRAMMLIYLKEGNLI